MAKEQPLPAGKIARVEENVEVIGLVDEHNPYWYHIRRSDGKVEQVNVSRLRWFADDPRCTIDVDGCIQIFTPKLTARGAICLYHWLRTNLAQLEEALASTSDGSTISTNPPSEGSTT